MATAPDASLSSMQAVTGSASLITAPPPQQHNLHIGAGPSVEVGDPATPENATSGCRHLSCHSSNPHLLKPWSYELMTPSGALPLTAGREGGGQAQYELPSQAAGREPIIARARQTWRRQLQAPGPLANSTQTEFLSSQVKGEAPGPAQPFLGRPRTRSRYASQRRLVPLPHAVIPKRRDSVDKQYSWAEWRGSHPSFGRLWQKAHTRYTKLVEVRLLDPSQPS
jgi:hypothetical protein